MAIRIRRHSSVIGYIGYMIWGNEYQLHSLGAHWARHRTICWRACVRCTAAVYLHPESSARPGIPGGRVRVNNSKSARCCPVRVAGCDISSEPIELAQFQMMVARKTDGCPHCDSQMSRSPARRDCTPESWRCSPLHWHVLCYSDPAHVQHLLSLNKSPARLSVSVISKQASAKCKSLDGRCA